MEAVVSSVTVLAGGLCGLRSGRVQHVERSFFFSLPCKSTLFLQLASGPTLNSPEHLGHGGKKATLAGGSRGPCFPSTFD